jgi:HSP20 family protein
MVISTAHDDIIPPSWSTSDNDQVESPEGKRWRILNRPHIWRPPTDVYETEDGIVIRVEIAGVRESDFNLYVDNHRVLINGIRSDIPERRAYQQMEIYYGDFNIEVELPVPVLVDQVQAVYRQGFLRVFLPKAQPLKINILDE